MHHIGAFHAKYVLIPCHSLMCCLVPHCAKQLSRDAEPILTLPVDPGFPASDSVCALVQLRLNQLRCLACRRSRKQYLPSQSVFLLGKCEHIQSWPREVGGDTEVSVGSHQGILHSVIHSP